MITHFPKPAAAATMAAGPAARGSKPPSPATGRTPVTLIVIGTARTLSAQLAALQSRCLGIVPSGPKIVERGAP